MPKHEDDGYDYADRRQITATAPRGVQHGTVPAPGLAVPHDLAAQAHRLHLQRRTRSLLISADYRMRQRVGHPDGGECPVEEILRAEEEQRAQIEFETRNGSRKHHRLPSALCQIAKLVLPLDFCPLLYFFAGFTGVAWGQPLSVNLVLAAALAATVTALGYSFLVFTGQRMRAIKNHAGTIYREELDGLTRLALGMALALATILAIVMFTWTRIEVRYALGAVGGDTADVIATAMTVINAVAHCLVIGVQALDGSDQVARLNKLSTVVHRSTATAHRMRHQAARGNRTHCKPSE